MPEKHFYTIKFLVRLVFFVPLFKRLQIHHVPTTRILSHIYLCCYRPSDVAVAAVASNNIVTVNKEQNVFDSRKKIKTAAANSVQHKLVSAQRQPIAMNQCLLYMYSNQGDECQRVAKQLQREHPNNAKPVLIEAAQFCRDKKIDAAIDLLKVSKACKKRNIKVLLLQCDFVLRVCLSLG